MRGELLIGFAAAILLVCSATSHSWATAPDIEMVAVKGGCYQMGDVFGDGAAGEKPVHEVCVPDFSIGKYEVTQAQWEAIMGNNPSAFKQCGSDCPVENVSWEDARDFIQKLNEQTGRNYRLPYEAEWEYAARSGGKHEQFAGTSNQKELGAYAWFGGNSGKRTHKVGTRRPNALGIYDMTGNVWEWCKDWYAANYYEKSPQKTPRGPVSGSSRVIRGGSWSYAAGFVRAASRSGSALAIRTDDYGFRLALPAAQ